MFLFIGKTGVFFVQFESTTAFTNVSSILIFAFLERKYVIVMMVTPSSMWEIWQKPTEIKLLIVPYALHFLDEEFLMREKRRSLLT